MATVTITCLHCGKQFTARGSHAIPYECRKGYVRRYCSRACFNEGRKIEIPTFECAHCGKVTERKRFRMKSGKELGFNYVQRFCSRSCSAAGQDRPRGYGKGFVDKNGYRLIRVDGREVFEHRHVMERSLGRALFSHETVHHRDGNRANNALSNLELWSSRHGKGQRVDDKIAFCRSFLEEYGYPVDDLVSPIFRADLRDLDEHLQVNRRA